MTIAKLEEQYPGGVQCIHVAVHLGISRASACRMMSAFEKEELICHKGRQVSLTPKGRELLEGYQKSYREIYPLFSKTVGLPDYDADQCAMALVLSLDGHAADKLCRQISDMNHRLY